MAIRLDCHRQTDAIQSLQDDRLKLQYATVTFVKRENILFFDASRVSFFRFQPPAIQGVLSLS